MPKAKPGGFYVVAKGFIPGIYETWAECEAQVKNFPGAIYKKFQDIHEAAKWEAEKTGGSNNRVTSSSTLLVADHSSASPGRNRSPRSAPYPQPSPGRIRASKGKERAYPQSNAAVESTIEDGWTVVYCDGACKGNGKVGSIAGLGVWWGANDPRNIAERCPGGQTNNRAELIAIIRVLETTPKSKDKLKIKTDSKYSINCIREWFPKWRRNGFVSSTGKPLKNIPVIRYLSTLIDERGQLGQIVEFEHVAGHVGIIGNEGADRLANDGCLFQEIPEPDWDTFEANVRKRMKEEFSQQQPVQYILEQIPDGAIIEPKTPTKLTSNSKLYLDEVAETVIEKRQPSTVITPTSTSTHKGRFKPAYGDASEPPPLASSSRAIVTTTPAPQAATIESSHNESRQTVQPIDQDPNRTPTFKPTPQLPETPQLQSETFLGAATPQFAYPKLCTCSMHPVPTYYRDVGVGTFSESRPGSLASSRTSSFRVTPTRPMPGQPMQRGNLASVSKLSSPPPATALPSVLGNQSQGKKGGEGPGFEEDELNAYAEGLLSDAELELELEDEF